MGSARERLVLSKSPYSENSTKLSERTNFYALRVRLGRKPRKRRQREPIPEIVSDADDQPFVPTTTTFEYFLLTVFVSRAGRLCRSPFMIVREGFSINFADTQSDIFV